MDVGPDDNSVDNDSDSDSRDDESVDGDEDDDVRSDDDDDDDDTIERSFEALAASNWGRALREALNRRAPLAEIRALVRRRRRRIPENLRTNIVLVGAWVLREVLRRSHRREEVGRGRAIRDRGTPLFYPTLPMIKFLVEEVDWGPSILHEKDENGYLALHWALIEHCPPAIVRYLVQMAPQSVRVEIEATGSKTGVIFPIHLALDRTDGGLVENDPLNEAPPIVDDFDVAPWETIQCLLDAWPESIQQPSHRGWIPLHHALRHLHRNRPNDRRVVRGLIERWPESISWPTQDEFRMLAFHVAVSESVPLPDLRYLLNLYPEAIHARTRSWFDPRRCQGYLPLHLAFVEPNGAERSAGNAPLPTIRFLVEACPSALKVRTALGYLPLHLALSAEVDDPDLAPDLDAVRYLVESYPESVREPNGPANLGWITLFYAGVNPHTSPDVIRYLVQQYPESVRVAEIDENGYLPLHAAVESDLSVAAIDALVRAGPEALRERTTDGDIPVHLLLRRSGRGRTRRRWQHDPRHGTLLDVLKCLVAHFPSSLGERSGLRGELPLHIALLVSLDRWSGSTEDEDAIIEYLMEQAPESVRIATRDRGWLALHCAAHKGRSDRVLRSLLNLWPNSVRQVTRDDNHQLLAIYLAASMLSTPLPSLQVLLDAWPDSAWERSGEGLLPIHYAAKKDGTPEFIQCFLESCSGDAAADLIAARSRDGFLPIHLAAARPCRYTYCAKTDRLQRRRKLEMIRFLVDHGPPDGLLLSGAAPDGSIPLHRAVQSEALDGDVVKYLVKRCPESVRHRDKNGSLALHVLVAEVQGDRRPANREVWWDPEPHRLRLQCLLGAAKLLVRSHPESLLVKDCGGRLPFHLAAEGDHASLDVLYLLLRRRPEAIQTGGRQERRGEDERGRRQRRRPASAASSRGRRSVSAAAASSKRRRSTAREVA